MAQRNDENAGIAIVLAIFAFIAMAIVAVIAGIVVVITVWATIGCIYAWNKPRDWDDGTIFPDEARAFIVRGAIMCALSLLISKYGVKYWDWEIDKAGWWCIGIAAYAVGSLGVQAMMSPYNEKGEPVIFPRRPIIIPADEPLLSPMIDITALSSEPPQPEAPRFEFADWSDEEVRS